MKRRLPLIILALLVVIQLVPVKRDTPPEAGPLQAAPEVMAVFQRSCFDCHSNRTQWPWYSRVAPVSWLVAGHVQEGREHLNFSEWENLPPKKRHHLAGEIMDEVAGGGMPLAGYTRLHPAARVTGADLNLVKAWAASVEP